MGEAKRRKKLDPSYGSFPKDRYVIYIPEIDAFFGPQMGAHPGEALRFPTQESAEAMTMTLLEIATKITLRRTEGCFEAEVCLLEDHGQQVGVRPLKTFFAEFKAEHA